MKPAILFPLLLAAAPALAQEVTATDMLGRAVTLPGPAERVIADTITGLGRLLALGIVPVASFCAPGTDPAPYLLAERNMVIPKGLPCINDNDWANDWEVIAAQSPDLFIGWSEEDLPAAEGIVPVYSAKAFAPDGSVGDSLDMYDASLRGIATLTGREAEAEAALAAMQARLAAYEAMAPEAPPRVLHVISGGDGSFAAFGGGSLNCQLLDRVADCAVEDGNTEFYLQGTSEMLLQIDPDVILLTAYDGDVFASPEAFAAQMASDPLWAELAAVKAGRAILLPHDARASSVFGITDYVDTVMPRLYPDLLNAPLTEAQVLTATE